MLNTIEKLYEMSILQKKKITEFLSDNTLDWPECPEDEFGLRKLAWDSQSVSEDRKKQNGACRFNIIRITRV